MVASASIDRAKVFKFVSSGEPQTLRVFTLGKFEVVQGDRVISSEQWRSGKARSLFKVMLARRNYQISRQEAEDLLWPELDQVRASNNLNQAVYNLRRTLEPSLERADASTYLKTEGSRLQLNAEMIGWIDLEEFERLYQQAVSAQEVSLYEQACILYAGHYLPEDLNEDWSVSRRENLRHKIMTMLLRMASLYEIQNQAEKYRQCLYRVLENDFSHEESVQKLMKSLAEGGRREEALNFYRKFTLKLKNQLDMEPLPETRQLYQAIAAGKYVVSVAPVKLPVSLPAVIAGVSKPTSSKPEFQFSLKNFQIVPAQPEIPANKTVRLVGREAELRRWVSILKNKANIEFVLLQGEAGSGKTALTEAMTQQAIQAGYLVLQVSCQSYQTLSPFNAIGQLLEQALNALSETELQECLSHCNNSLFNLLPQFAASSNNSSSGGVEPEALAIAANLIFTYVSRKWPLLLALDNLHYVSTPALQLLQDLLASNSSSKLLILGTCRPVALSTVSPELRHLLKWIAERQQPVLRLERLGSVCLNQLLTTTHKDLRSSQITFLEKYSQGNPKLALELATFWQNSRYTSLDNQSWQPQASSELANWLPTSVCSYLQGLIENLSEDARTLLSLAALIGPTFSFEMLRRIVWQRSDGAGWWISLDKTKLGQTLVELIESELLVEQGLSYRFAYPLLLEVIQLNISNIQRQCWLEVINWVQEGHNNYD